MQDFFRSLLSLVFLLSVSSALATNWIAANASRSSTFGASSYSRHECAAVGCHVNGRALGVMVGGRGGLRHPVIYDVGSNNLSLGAQSPAEIHHFQAVLWRDSIVVAGMGFVGGYPNETPSPNVLAYKVKSNTWQVLTNNIPSARRRGSAASVIVGDWVYYFCGLTQGHRSGWVNWTDRYNLATNTWQTLPNAPRARDHCAAVLHNNKVYLAGGRRSAENNGGLHRYMVDEIDVFDLSTQTWSTLTAQLPTSRAGVMAAVQINLAGHAQLNIWGGEALDAWYAYHTYSLGEGLDLSSMQWSTVPSLVDSTHGNQIVRFSSDSLVLIAGAYDGGWERSVNDVRYVQLNISGPALGGITLWDKFDVESRPAGVQLTWRFPEVEPGTFLIERTRENERWIALDRVPVADNRTRIYQYTDDRIPGSGYYHYRVVKIDPDGQRIATSPVKGVYAGALLKIFPNPVNRKDGRIYLEVAPISARLHLLSGKVVLLRKEEEVLFLPPGIGAGIYLLEVEISEGKVAVKKILVR